MTWLVAVVAVLLLAQGCRGAGGPGPGQSRYRKCVAEQRAALIMACTSASCQAECQTNPDFNACVAECAAKAPTATCAQNAGEQAAVLCSTQVPDCELKEDCKHVAQP